MAVTFEGYERRVEKINACLAENGIASLEEAEQICLDKGVNAREIVHDTQSIAFQNAEWAYTLGCALALKRGVKTASEAASVIGEGIQAFTVPGSVAEDRKVGLGHGNLGAMLLSDDTECFAFLAGHESFAAAEGAIKLALNANKARQKPLRVILNGLGKDAAQIIARINGFTYVKTQFDYFTGELKIVETIPYSDGPRAVQCEADKVGRTVEKEAAARHFVVVSIDTIEVAVEQQSHIFTIYGLKFKMLQMSQ